MAIKVRIDRRKHARFLAQTGAFAVLGRADVIFGLIIDIGLGGLSFKYMDEGYRVNGKTEMEILLTANGFHLKAVPSQPISDIALDEDVDFSFIRMRRCSIQFSEISQHYLSRFEYFIQNYTVAIN